VIRFSAFLVAIALGLLVAGVVTSKLVLVYVAIGVSGVALLALGVGALIKRKELFGQPESAQSESTGPRLAEPGLARSEPTAGHVPPAQAEPQVAPWEAPVPAASAWPPAAPPAPSRAGYLPTDQPPRPAAFTPRPPAGSPPAGSPPAAPVVPPPTPGAWDWHDDAPATQVFPRAEPPSPSVPEPAEPPQPAASQAAESPPAAGSQPPAQDEPSAPQDQQPVEEDLGQLPDKPSADSQPSAEDRPATEDQPPDERSAGDQQTQQLPIVVGSAAQPTPAPSSTAPASSGASEPAAPESAAPAASEPATPEPTPATVDLQREVTVVPGVPRYHNPHCLLIRFMGQDDLDKMTLGAARKIGCTPCRACLPDQPEENPELGRSEPERQAEIVLDVLPRRHSRNRARLSRSRTRTRPGLDREHLTGDQPRVLG
jgi:hypothetical protein